MPLRQGRGLEGVSAEGGERVSASVNEPRDTELHKSREAVEMPQWGWERQQVRWL